MTRDHYDARPQLPSPQQSTAPWPILTSGAAEGRRLSWSEWLVTYRGGISPNGHLSQYYNQARRRVTSLMISTMLPLKMYCLKPVTTDDTTTENALFRLELQKVGINNNFGVKGWILRQFGEL